jgi:hypothetical protein
MVCPSVYHVAIASPLLRQGWEKTDGFGSAMAKVKPL